MRCKICNVALSDLECTDKDPDTHEFLDTCLNCQCNDSSDEYPEEVYDDSGEW